MWLIKASLKNAYMVAALVFVMMALGIISIFSIPVDILPVFKTPAVQVLTYYQGMPATSVEKTITNRIERWVNQAEGAAQVESRSLPGVSVVKVYFRDEIDPNKALTQTNSLALGALPTLPPNTLPSVVLPFDPTGTLPLGILTVSNRGLDEARVKDLARIDVRNMLGDVKGSVAPVVVGGKDRTVLIYLNPKRLQDKKLSPLDVVNALQKQNLMVTPGTAYFGPYQTLLDSNALVKHVADLNDIPIRVGGDANVYLRDVGHAEDSYAIQTSRVRIDGKPQVYVPIYRQGGASTLSVVKGIQKKLPEIEERLPEPNTELKFVMDQSVYVREAIMSLIHEGIIGAVMVSVMILIFLGNVRMTLIATLSIPLAILGSITCLHLTGNTINAMTLGGLALAIGPLVDDAIVELENNHRNYHLGKSRIRAALDGCAEVMVPVMVATCTTIIVLTPLATMEGMAGFLFRPLALAVAFAMLASFLLSRTFVPMMCAKFLPDEHRRGFHQVGNVNGEHAIGWFGTVHGYIDRFLVRQTKRYERLLAAALRHRQPVLYGALVLFLCSLCLLPFIGREFFPQVDAGQLTIYVRAPSDLRLDAAEKRVAAVERFIKRQIPAEDREMIVSEMGLDPDWSAAYTANAGQQDTIVRVQLTEKRKHSAQEYAIQLRHAFAADGHFNDLRFNFDTGGMVSTALNYGVSSPIDIQIEGGTTTEAYNMAREIRRQITGVPGQSSRVRGAVDVRINQRLGAPYLFMDVDRQKAARVGLTESDVIQQVVAAMNSSVTINRNFWIDPKSGNQYFVGVQYAEEPNATREKLENIPVTGIESKDTVPLSTLVTFTSSTDAVEVDHVSLYRTFNVLVNTENRDVGSLAHEIQTRVDKLKVAKGMRVRLLGEYQRMNESFVDLGLGMVKAVLFVYLLLVALFRSWVGPFIIMFTVPLGLIGVLSMLFVTRTTLNVQSLMGIIFLVGIAVNNGVLLVEFANKQRRLGATVHQAITTAAAIRFRPILMTFLATFLDLTPMAIGFGKGSEATVPLARAVVGGLLTSTLLTLIVVPILYTLLMREADLTETDIDAELSDRPESLIAIEEAVGVGEEVAAATREPNGGVGIRGASG